MSIQMTCAGFRESLVDARAGALTEDDRSAWEAHRAACSACAAEAARDAWLCEALGGMAPEAPPAFAWSEVLAARRRPAKPLVRPALAFATAALALLMLTGPLRHRHDGLSPTPSPSAPPAVARSSDAGAYAGAHALVSMTDLSGDPNRAVVLVYGGQQAATEGGGS